MPRIAFEDLPDHGRIWIFPADRALAEAEARVLLDEVDRFLDGWAAHGVPLRCARTLRHDRFLIVGVDEDAEAPSGCSIDALMNSLAAMGAAMDVELLDHAPVWYRDGEEIRCVSRRTFRALAEAGEVGPETRVFDPTLTRLKELRGGALERPARESWHGRAFFR